MACTVYFTTGEDRKIVLGDAKKAHVHNNGELLMFVNDQGNTVAWIPMRQIMYVLVDSD